MTMFEDGPTDGWPPLLDPVDLPTMTMSEDGPPLFDPVDQDVADDGATSRAVSIVVAFIVGGILLLSLSLSAGCAAFAPPQMKASAKAVAELVPAVLEGAAPCTTLTAPGAERNLEEWKQAKLELELHAQQLAESAK